MFKQDVINAHAQWNVKDGLSCHADLLYIPFVIAPWYMVSVWIIDHLHMVRLESIQGIVGESGC